MKKSILVFSILSSMFLYTSCNSNESSPSSEESGTAEIVEDITPIGSIDVNTFKMAIANPDVQLIDVRTPEEYSTGSIGNAKNINFNSPDFKAQIEQLDKSKPVYLYCKSGGRSGNALKVLQEMGFSEVHDLQGGIMNWENSGNTLNNGQAASPKATSQPESMDMGAFNAIVQEKKNVVFDFYADWCGPCKQLAPALAAVEKANGKFEVVKINVDKSKELAQQFKISSIPLLMVYKDGKEAGQILGYEGPEILSDKLNGIFN